MKSVLFDYLLKYCDRHTITSVFSHLYLISLRLESTFFRTPLNGI